LRRAARLVAMPHPRMLAAVPRRDGVKIASAMRKIHTTAPLIGSSPGSGHGRMASML